MSIEIVNGRVFIEGKETIDPALIGYAMLDMAEEAQNVSFHPITDRKLLSIINNQSELTALNAWLQKELHEFLPDLNDKICMYWEQIPFVVNCPSSDILFNLIMMIKNGQIVFRDQAENEIRQLQNKVHKISGNGEIMGLFNELLGVCAG